MSQLIDAHKNFLQYISHTVNYNQLYYLLLQIDKQQLHCIREISLNIISKKGAIHLEEDTKKRLQSSWNFLDKLVKDKISIEEFAKNSNVISEIVRLGLQHYAICR